MEYFDANAKIMLKYDPNNRDNLLFDTTDIVLDIGDFGSFISENILFINGGQSTENENELNPQSKYG